MSESPELRLIEGGAYSVYVPGALSEEVEKRVVIVDEHEIDVVENLSRRLDDIGAGVTGALLRRLVGRWKAGPTI